MSPQETLYLDLAGEHIFPQTMNPEEISDNGYEFAVLSGLHHLTEKTGDDYAIGTLHSGSTPVQIVNRIPPIEDYPQIKLPEDWLVCISWRPESSTLQVWQYKHQGSNQAPTIIHHQPGDYIVWIGNGELYNICRQRPFQPGDLTDLNPPTDQIPQPMIEPLLTHLPPNSHLRQLLTRYQLPSSPS